MRKISKLVLVIGICMLIFSGCEKEENQSVTQIRTVRIDGSLYYDTGKESTLDAKCGTMDGEISSTVGQSQMPKKDGQSNFGKGYGYQYVDENTINIFIQNKWITFSKDIKQEE